MNKDNRISSLPQVSKLNCFTLEPFPSSFLESESVDDDVLFLIANSGAYNEKITFKNLKSSVLDSSILLTGVQTANGEKTFTDSCTFLSDVFVEDYIKRTEEEPTSIYFEEDKITFTADQQITFNVNNDNKLIIDQDGNVGINIEEQMGKLSVTGDAYTQDLYITNDQGEWRRYIERKEESVNFNTNLESGQEEYDIDFPKTFESPPSLSISVQSSTGPFVPHIISQVTEYNYKIKFSEALPNESYQIHTVAKPTGITSYRQTKTVSFTHDLSVGNRLFTVPFPESFLHPPMVAINLETNGTMIPYNIKSTSKDDFEIIFASDLSSEVKLHIHATR